MSSFDETIKQGITRASISNVSNVIRRFSELKAAINIIDDLNENDIVFLDGSLQCTFTNEKKYMDKLYEKATKEYRHAMGVLVCASTEWNGVQTKPEDLPQEEKDRLAKLRTWKLNVKAEDLK